MGPFDAYIVYKFVRLLTSAWDGSDAFRTGVIDASGKVIVDTNYLNDKQKQSYTLFHRLVFNIKRLIEKLPGGKTKIGTYAAALFLLKEEMGDSEGVLVLEKSFMSYIKDNDAVDEKYLAEQYKPSELLDSGSYKLVHSMLDADGHQVSKGTIVYARSTMKPSGRVLGVDVYELVLNNGHKVVISHEDIAEA